MASSVLLQPRQETKNKVLCYHCHEECLDAPLQMADKIFCCEGCKMVFQILNEHGLCNFYNIEGTIGINLKNAKSATAYAYLDDWEVQEKLLEFCSAESSQVTFYLPQMHCVSCIWLLENLYKLDAGVSHSRVNFLKKTLTIVFNPADTTLRKLASMLNSIGYGPEINLGDVDKVAAPKISRTLAYQLGLAGFAFGNIMLFSFPEYVGMDEDTFRWFADIFGYLSIVLAIPVLLFSAKDYFIAAWQGLRTRQLNINIPLCLALASLFGRSIWEITTHTGAGYLDSFAGLTFLLLIGRWFQQHTWHQLSFERDYKSYFPVAATVKKGDSEQPVPIHRLVPGDIIVVRSQELIPADGILLRGPALVDYSFVSGEANPVRVNSGERIFAGGKQVGQSIEVSLTRRVSQSGLTRLWNDMAFKEAPKGTTTKLADQAGRIFSWIILTVGGGSLLYWGVWEHNATTALNAFTAVMIVACPCTVALSIPFTLGNILRILGRHRFYLKNITVVEAFSSIDSVVFDKTGTITNVAQQEFTFQGKPLGYAEKVAIRSLTKHSAHPLSRRIYESMPQIPVEKPDFFEEIPGKGILGTVHGVAVKIGSSEYVTNPHDNPQVAEKSGVFISINDQYLGYYEVISRFRDGLSEVLAFFRQDTKAGQQPSTVNTWLLSGDHAQDIRSLSPFFPESDTMLFNRNPHDKLHFIKKLQNMGQKVMMIGDGLNDSGALRQSDLGIVVAENTNNFTPACDAIIHAEEFSNLPKFVALAQAGVKIVRWSYAVALTYNIIGLSFAVSGQLSPLIAAILMPVSSISIVLFGVGLGNLNARKLRQPSS